MNNKLFIIFFLLYLFSRLIFANPQAVFFDSPEYLTRLSDNNFLNALSSGHLPLHVGYIMIFWPVFHLAKIINFNPALFVIFFQSVLSFAGILCFYKIIEFLSNKKTALLSSLIVSIIPIFWISNSTIMMETTYVSFFFISYYFFIKYSIQTTSKYLYLGLAVFSFILSFITHIIVMFWIPLIIYNICYKNINKIPKFLFIFIITFFIASLINGYFIGIYDNSNIIRGIYLLFSSKIEEHANLPLNIHSVLVILRNFLIPLFRNNTIALVSLSFVSEIILLKSNTKLSILIFLWVMPSLITNQWWDSLLYGRHSLLSSFGIAFAAGLLIVKNRFFYYCLIIYILISTIPALFLLKKDIPYLMEAKTINNLSENGLLIESHFARPQVDKEYKGKVIFVEEPGWKKEELKNMINENFKYNKPVFITSQALSEPYGLYSGPYLHSLSLSYSKNFILYGTISDFTLKKYIEISKNDDLYIYKIILNKKNNYPNIANKKYNYRRIDYYDPIMQFWFLINSQFLHYQNYPLIYKFSMLLYSWKEHFPSTKLNIRNS